MGIIQRKKTNSKSINQPVVRNLIRSGPQVIISIIFHILPHQVKLVFYSCRTVFYVQLQVTQILHGKHTVSFDKLAVRYIPTRECGIDLISPVVRRVRKTAKIDC